MNKISKIINDDPEYITERLSKSDKTIDYYKKKKNANDKFSAFFGVMFFIHGWALFDLCTSSNKLNTFTFSIMGFLLLAYGNLAFQHFYAANKASLNLMACNRCYPAIELYLKTTSENEVLGIEYKLGLDVSVIMTVVNPSGEVFLVKFDCVKKFSSEVDEVTWNVGEMTVYLPKQ